MDIGERDWRLVREESWDGPMNMALDEVAAETAAEEGLATLRVYRWEPGTLSLGYHQDPATVDWAVCEREGITVTRRPTGGGAIYHDSWGDISYAIVAPAADLPGDLLDAYEMLCEPILDALDALGVDAGYAAEERPALYQPACYLREMHPAHDVVAPDGRKLSGNAQYRQQSAVIQHGSISFERTAERHLACFADPGVTPGEFAERVTAIADWADCSRADAVAAFEEALAAWADAEDGEWTDAERRRARERAAEKYENDAWVRDGEDPT